jgi:hypothetical protein
VTRSAQTPESITRDSVRSERLARVTPLFGGSSAICRVVAQTAENETFTKNVQTIFSNDLENKTKTGVGKKGEDYGK